MDTTGAAGYGAIMKSVAEGMAGASAKAAAQYTEVWAAFAEKFTTVIGATPLPEDFSLATLLAKIFEALLGMGAIRQTARVNVHSTTRSERIRRFLAGVRVGYGGDWGGDISAELAEVINRGEAAEAALDYQAETMQVGSDGWAVIQGTVADSLLPGDLKQAVSALVAAELVKMTGDKPGAGLLALLPEPMRADYAGDAE